jgi:hypothetical protein
LLRLETVTLEAPPPEPPEPPTLAEIDAPSDTLAATAKPPLPPPPPIDCARMPSELAPFVLKVPAVSTSTVPAPPPAPPFPATPSAALKTEPPDAAMANPPLPPPPPMDWAMTADEESPVVWIV